MRRRDLVTIELVAAAAVEGLRRDFRSRRGPIQPGPSD